MQARREARCRQQSGSSSSSSKDPTPPASSAAASGPLPSGSIGCTANNAKWGQITLKGTSDELKITTEKGAKPSAVCKKSSDPKKLTCTWTEGKKTTDLPLSVEKDGTVRGAYPAGSLYSCKPK